MANDITENGIETDDLSTIISDLETAFKEVYGQDINLEQSTPDGQMINIFAEAKIDTLELATQLYNIFNSETVIGRAQDNLYRLVGLYRKSSAYSFVQVNVTTTEAVSLSGLDDDIESADGVGYTVSDTNGNNYILSNSIDIETAGTYLLEFRAQEVGAVQVLPNTIVNMVTVVRGVSAVNNPAVQYLTGNDAETDAEFRIRFNKSRALSGLGFGDSLLAALLNINLVSDAKVYQNRTNVVNADGTPAHSVWVVVEGGADDDVASAIYANLTDGCGMRGDVEVTVSKSNGLVENIRFDRPVAEPLYVKATLKNLSVSGIDVDTVKENLINNLTFKIYTPADTATITSILHTDTCIPYNVMISSDGSSWEEYLYPSAKGNIFTLSADNITLEVV